MQVWFEYASIMAKLGRCDEAMVNFQKATPRFVDCEDAASQICLIKGDIPSAIAMQKQTLNIMNEDWTTEGESVDCINREIKRLKAML